MAQILLYMLLSSLAAFSNNVRAQDDVAAGLQNLQQSVRELRQKTLLFDRDLAILDEAINYPAATRVTIFISLRLRQDFALQSVKLSLDGTAVSTRQFHRADIQALQRGAVQRLYTGNIDIGRHRLTALISGLLPDSKAFSKPVTLNFTKSSTAAIIRLDLLTQEKIRAPGLNLKMQQ